MKKHVATYWILQLTGWSMYCVGYIFLYLTILTWREQYFYAQLATHALSGLLLTHIMRSVIQRSGALDCPFKKTAPDHGIAVALLFFPDWCNGGGT